MSVNFVTHWFCPWLALSRIYYNYQVHCVTFLSVIFYFVFLSVFLHVPLVSIPLRSLSICNLMLLLWSVHVHFRCFILVYMSAIPALLSVSNHLFIGHIKDAALYIALENLQFLPNFFCEKKNKNHTTKLINITSANVQFTILELEQH